MRELIKRAGAILRFLPPYSHDFNPIEPGWALMKKSIRKVAPRTGAALRCSAQRARRLPRRCGQSGRGRAAEGGLGFELVRTIESQEINASVAFEFREGNADANLTDQFQTDFSMIRGSVIIPVTSGNSFSINVGKPMSGNVSPILSVNFNWGLLLSNALRR